MDRQMTLITATFFTITGLLILSGDIALNSLAVAVIMLTVAVIQWANYLTETRRHKEFVKRIDERKTQQYTQTALFDQDATQEYTPDTDWTK